LELDELVEHFTLLPDEVARLRNKSGPTRLGFALLLAREEHRNGNWRQRRSFVGAGPEACCSSRPTGPITRVAADAEISHLMRQRLSWGHCTEDCR